MTVRIEEWAINRLMDEARPGSKDWDWPHEMVHMFSAEHWPITEKLIDSMAVEGQREPILLGNDGRVWDGHHRIAAALYLGMETVTVELTDPEPRYHDFVAKTPGGRWCGDFAGAHGMHPPLDILRDRHQGKRITKQRVEQAIQDHRRASRGKRKKGRAA